MKAILRLAGTYLKVGIREKTMSFWVLIFPQLLMIFMYLGLSGLRGDPQMELRVGISADNPYKMILEYIDVIQLNEMPEDQALVSIHDDQIDAFVQNDLNVLVAQRGIRQEVIRGIMSDVKQMAALGPRAMKIFDYPDGIAREEDKTENQLAVYLYSLVAMSTLFGYYCASEFTGLFQANQSALAQRNAVSPISKAKGILAGFAAALVTISLTMLILLLLSEFVLKIGLIVHLGPTLLLLLGGMLFGIAWGLPVGASKLPEWLKIMMGTMITVLLAMLSGMMSVEVRQQIMLHTPWLHYLNPVSIMSQGLYQINILGKTAEGLKSLGILGIYSVILTALAIFLLRKQTYQEL